MSKLSANLSKIFSLDNIKKPAFIVDVCARLVAINSDINHFVERYNVFHIDTNDQIIFSNYDMQQNFLRRIIDLAGGYEVVNEDAADMMIYHDEYKFRFLFLPMKNTCDTSDSDTAKRRISDETFMVTIDAYKYKSHDDDVVEILSNNYKLTKSELRLIIQIVDGYTLSDIANNTKTSIHTVRTHLKSIFMKMNIGRQQELITLYHNIRNKFQ